MFVADMATTLIINQAPNQPQRAERSDSYERKDVFAFTVFDDIWTPATFDVLPYRSGIGTRAERHMPIIQKMRVFVCDVSL